MGLIPPKASFSIPFYNFTYTDIVYIKAATAEAALAQLSPVGTPEAPGMVLLAKHVDLVPVRRGLWRVHLEYGPQPTFAEPEAPYAPIRGRAPLPSE